MWLLAVHPVLSHPVSGENSLLTGSLQGKTYSFRELAVLLGCIAPAFQGLRGNFPNRSNREITLLIQGNEIWEQGQLSSSYHCAYSRAAMTLETAEWISLISKASP